eukprot:gene17260-17450_t
MDPPVSNHSILLLTTAPLILGAANCLFVRRQRFLRPYVMAEIGAVAAFLVSCCALWSFYLFGSGVSPVIGVGNFGLSVLTDAVSIIMTLLVTFIGWVVVRYSRTYLDGEPRQGLFMGQLSLTLVAVILLVSAGNLVQLLAAWVATSLLLHKLLLFYPDRGAARRAARKKFITARLGDAALLAACVLLVSSYKTIDITVILGAAQQGESSNLVMGFMVFECGLALFPMALLHIVAHSLYKAHSFLSSGGAVERVAAIRRPGPVAIPNSGAVCRAFVSALAIYVLVGLCFGLTHKSPQAIALGAILIFGVAYMLAQGFADAAPKALTRRTAVYAVATSVGYFALQIAVSFATRSTLPAAPLPGPLEWTLIVLSVISFGLVAMVQAMFPLWAYHPAATGLRVHLSNGFYANAVFNRLIRGWSASHQS